MRIEGATHVRDRHTAVAAFRKDPDIRVALLSVTAAGTPCTSLQRAKQRWAGSQHPHCCPGLPVAVAAMQEAAAGNVHALCVFPACMQRLTRRGAGTGLDFSAASCVVFAELPGEVAVVQQAEDRAHRQGQQLPVNVYFLLARGTTDDRRCKRAAVARPVALSISPVCPGSRDESHLLARSAAGHGPGCSRLHCGRLAGVTGAHGCC